MTEHELYDEKLTTIKAFNSYLSSIINKGYNNDYETLLHIVKHINNFQDDIIETGARNNIDTSFMELDDNMFNDEPIYYNNNSNLNFISSSSSSSSSSEETNEDEEDDEKLKQQHKEKELQKIKKFINESDDLSKIYLYKKNNNYIKQLEKFMNNSLIY